MPGHSYRPLTSRQYRLLTLLPGAESAPIQTTLRHVNLEDKPSFDALSYEWGPESTNNSQVYVDNVLFTIRHNLWLFLKRLRASSHNAHHIYADAICINQSDNEEKGHQVALMSEIYMRAKKVLVWLGEHDPSSEMVFGTNLQDYVDGMPRGFRALPCLLPITIPLHIANRAKQVSRRFGSGTERVSAWTSLLSRSYWNRTWIIQEFLLARSVVIYCGADHMSGDLIFTKPLQDHFSRMIRKNKGALEGIPRSFLLFFWKQNQKHHGVFGRGKPYFPNTDIFELAFNFQYTECQKVLDHVFGLLALEDPSKSPPITPNYNISAQNLFIEICMVKLPMAAGVVNKVTDDGVVRVAMLFRGLKLTFDDAEEILDILFSNNQSRPQNRFVVATIAKAFDQFGLLKPERTQWILPQTRSSLPADQIISIVRQWQMSQKQNGNWYNLHHTAQIHEPPGMEFLQLDEPLWSHYSTLRDTEARKAAGAAGAANAQNINNMNMNINTMNLNNMNLNNINIMNINNAAMMGPAGGGFAGGAGGPTG
ncbi:heterokaryon incompatibility protein-domain-containing protein [Xylogone sp. PMI_703]|nr:heterokaryon incompatibility protein-domain-containing protein [Xylogone sp. PMI_703]